MDTKTKTKITVQATVHAPVNIVWEKWTNPDDIVQWNSASDDWHTTRAENDLRIGGKFMSRMEAKDGSMGFDFNGVYHDLRINELIDYTMEDGRKARITFSEEGSHTKVVETFEAEDENPIDLQRMGWQAILDNFKKHVESGK
jgi:uncharacterized protein YndB with AHSA1/START domain